MAFNLMAHQSADHARLERLVAALAEATPATARQLLPVIGESLRLHCLAEETVLFPLWEERVLIAGPLPVLTREHRAIEDLLAAIDEATHADDAAALARATRRLEAALAEHHRKEELILYPRIERVLQPRERAELAVRLAGA